METIDRNRTGRVTEADYAGGAGLEQSQAYGRRWPVPPEADETKPFFWTSEFLTMLFAVMAVSICTAVFDSLDLARGMTLVAAITGAYIVSRGIAKAGTRHVDRGDYGVR